MIRYLNIFEFLQLVLKILVSNIKSWLVLSFKNLNYLESWKFW